MLSQILQALASKQTLSLTQLAQQVGYSVREVESAMEQLERMGYIRREQMGQACASTCEPKGASQCEGCSFNAGELLTSWLITDRGRMLVDSGSSKG